MLLVTSRRSKISRSFAKVKLGFAHLLDCLSIPNEQVNILSSIETFGAVIRVDQVFDDFLCPFRLLRDANIRRGISSIRSV